jgi:hypothetical protein
MTFLLLKITKLNQNIESNILGLTSTCKAAEEFCIDPSKMMKLKYRLLDRWLPEKVPMTSTNELDETVTNFDFLQNFSNNRQNGDDSGEDISRENEVNYLRCVYILQGCEFYDYLLQVWILLLAHC